MVELRAYVNCIVDIDGVHYRLVGVDEGGVMLASVHDGGDRLVRMPSAEAAEAVTCVLRERATH